MPYIGRGSEGFGIRERFQYTATSGQVAFSGSDLNSKTLAFDNGSLVDVLLNGVVLKPTTDYNTSTANTVTLVSGATTSDEVMIIVYDVFALSDAMPKTGGTFTGALAGVDVNGTELILDADADTSITADTDDQIDIKVGGTDTLIIKPDDLTLQGPHPSLNLIDSDDSNQGGIFYNNGTLSVGADTGNTGATGLINFQIDGNTDVQINGGGDLDIKDGNLVIGTSGHGIDFSATANSTGSMDNELFDDYEEGTWTWTLTDGSNNATVTAGGWGTGYYRKIGGLAYVTAYVRVSSIGSMSGDSKITGLPYTSLSGNTIGTASGFASGRATNLNVTAGQVLGYQVGAGVSEAQLRLYDDAGGTTAMQASEISGDAIFIMTVIYPTA